MLTSESVSRLFNDFNRLRVMVVGDVMVDSYLFGHVDRISPEAPVPVVAVSKRSDRLGGAANVALNLKALGAEAILCSVVGDDYKGLTFNELLIEYKLPVHGIIKSKERTTTTKFRVIGNNVQMLRVDEEDTHDLSLTETKELLFTIRKIVDHDQIDAIILQDYNKGVLTPEIIETVISLAKAKNIPVSVDPKKKNFLAYKNATFFKPNLKELQEGLHVSIKAGGLSTIVEAISELQSLLQVDYVMTTLSERGLLIRYPDGDQLKELHLPAHLRSIADVSGAGDTVISVATLCLALQQEAENIAALANLAGGIVCEEVGVVPIDKNKFHDEVLRLMVR
ncbi:MAG: D-glycero-beta-D-manno-heptose-7-phosphate kinase [Bacteroidetes bacterium]|nr:D-glycero-beta-D-manno-heptose-7-phosphate kinase [Bacteroidota bacterium]MBU1580491.1 D-glycero-beta-D-manno-heptose-7-phosphate kinase [Bacteroidota bacterium]MBU2557716.1 D-glycero-beta-D-manno-heptose-7-phosphate kinase [Bacteroidota bacterium]